MSTNSPVPFLDLKTPHQQLADEILPVWKKILEGAGFIGGPEVAGFEEEFAAFCATRHCVSVSSGTDALVLAMIGMGVERGSEVITVPHTFIATTEAISQAGGKIVFVDVDPASATMDPSALEAAITPRTRLIVPVHLYGQPADMDPIREIADRHGIPVLEDAAQAHGAAYHDRPAGSLAHGAAFSFYPGKNLGACGEAGAFVTDDEALATRVRVLRDHGQPKKYHHEVEGFNARCDALQAAALRIKLRHLPGWNDQRREIAAAYAAGLRGSGVEIPEECAGRRHVYHLYVVRHPQRDQIQQFLGERQIASGLHYPIPLHRQKAYASMALPDGSFPISERWAYHGVSLPMFPGMTQEQVERVCGAIQEMKLDPATVS